MAPLQDTTEENRTARERLGADFREAFRHHPGGIAIIAGADADGPAGMTASSVASVSVTPTTVLFSLMRGSRSADCVLRAERLSVNLLHAGHAQLARDFATRGAPRFTPGQNWERLDDGTPVLADAAACLIGHVTHTVELGEAVVVVAEITEVRTGEPGEGLVYRDRRFHGLSGDSALE
ncbi:flavin reductase family protein [Brevibacterium album]|uniref:flavin reductase family protein n=1 Tax=Brevibacterium album TaxID=417948 RepID=UPI00040F10F4|nr:flavin reductase family protein [Brevibacterium album]